MAPPPSLITGLVQLWDRLPDPEAQDLVRALRLARLLEADPEAPSALLGFAWGLVEAEHAAAGWEVQPIAHSPRCEAAAGAARLKWPPLAAALEVETRRSRCDCLVLGLPAASRALFGAWDLLPADGLELVLLGASSHDSGPSSPGPVRLRPAGELADLYESHSAPSDLGGCPVRVPTAPLLAALAAEGAPATTGADSLVFVAAAFRVTGDRRWTSVDEIAERLGSARAPRLAAARLGLEDKLGLERKGVSRLKHALRRILVE